jgi:hypothetical protein
LTVGAVRSRELLYISGDMNWLHRGDRRHVRKRAPGQKFLARFCGDAPGVRIADVGGEKLEEAHARLVAGGSPQANRCSRMASRWTHGRLIISKICSVKRAREGEAMNELVLFTGNTLPTLIAGVPYYRLYM